MNPLVKKLLIKPGQTWLVLNAPENYLNTLEPLPDNVKLKFSVEQADGIQLFVKNRAELSESIEQVKSVLKPETVLWFIYPKKSSAINTGLDMMIDRDEVKKYGLRPVTSAAINDTWTALRFRPEELVNKSESSTAAIQANNLSAYIDPVNKQITLPGDVASAFSASPTAMQMYDGLSWTNKKEYIVWILTAKQEQTRTKRIAQSVEKLSAGKKNRR